MDSEGRVVVHRLSSQVLKGNPLGDPVDRDLFVYLPAGVQGKSDHKCPALLAVVGFTGTGASLFNRDPLGEDLKSRMDRLIKKGVMPPTIIVAPDCFTRVGGNQYINSSATGNYEDYLLKEVIPFVEKTYSVGNWGVFGKSSGGYGAIVLGMRHPEIFKALADHSGDSNFELCYIPDVSKALDAFLKAGGPKEWLEKFWADKNHHRREYNNPLNILAMAAHYSPNPQSPHLGIDFPFDLKTGVFDFKVWERWRAWDPVNMVEKYAENLKKLRLIYIDCGTRDEFALHWGARALAKAIVDRGIKVHHEEFDDGHMSISYRYDTSLPLLAKALVPEGAF